jgi:hypothetical protein
VPIAGHNRSRRVAALDWGDRFTVNLLDCCLVGIHWIRWAQERNRWIGAAPVLAAILSQAIRLPMPIPPSLYGLSQRLSLFCRWLGIAATAGAFPRRFTLRPRG